MKFRGGGVGNGNFRWLVMILSSLVDSSACIWSKNWFRVCTYRSVWRCLLLIVNWSPESRIMYPIPKPNRTQKKEACESGYFHKIPPTHNLDTHQSKTTNKTNTLIAKSFASSYTSVAKTTTTHGKHNHCNNNKKQSKKEFIWKETLSSPSWTTGPNPNNLNAGLPQFDVDKIEWFNNFHDSLRKNSGSSNLFLAAMHFKANKCRSTPFPDAASFTKEECCCTASRRDWIW